MTPSVDILLATYNGAQYLPELLASLEAQTHATWRLIVRDDGSTDGTPELVRDWAETAGRTVRFIEDGDNGLGALGNFSRLLEAADAPYFMFCDQDDVWLPEKVALSVEEVERAEQEIGVHVPVLAHCDLRVVDENLRETEPSFWAHQGFRFTRVGPGDGSSAARKSLLIRNMVTGCAMIGNAALRDRATPVPHDCVMHDWWLALVAAHTGEIRAIDQQCILYRQHGSNTLGAKGWTPTEVASRVLSAPRAAVHRTHQWLRSSRQQAARLQAILPEDYMQAEGRHIADYAGSESAGWLARKTYMNRHDVWPQSKMRAVIMFLIM